MQTVSYGVSILYSLMLKALKRHKYYDISS